MEKRQIMYSLDLDNREQVEKFKGLLEELYYESSDNYFVLTVSTNSSNYGMEIDEQYSSLEKIIEETVRFIVNPGEGQYEEETSQILIHSDEIRGADILFITRKL